MKLKIFLVYDYSSLEQSRALLSGLAEKGLEVLGRERLEEEKVASVTPRDWTSLKQAWHEQADLVLVVVGEQTYRDTAVESEIHEIGEHRKQNIPIVAVNTQRTNVTPKWLYGVNVRWASSFSVEDIDRAIKGALELREK
jgi:hypothetical protein